MREKLQGRFLLSPRMGAWVLIAICAVLLLIRYPANTEAYRTRFPSDYGVYLKAWDRAEARQNPYVASDSSPYKYSPGVLALVQALPREPGQSWVVFSTICILGLALSLILGARYPNWKSVGLLGVGLVLAWKGILETLDYGQLELLILLLAVLAASLRRRHPLAAGFVAGALPWFKLPWILLALPLILGNVASLQGPGRKERKVRLVISGYLFAWFFWGAALPSVVFGSERSIALTQAWIEVLRDQPQALYFTGINQSVWISALRWLGGNPLLAFGLTAILTGFILGSLVSRALRANPGRDVLAWLSPWLLLTQLLNPLSWRWGSVFLVGIPFAISASYSRARFVRWPLYLAALVLFLLQLNPVVRALGYHHWSDFHDYGVVTGYWLALLLLCL